MTATPKQVADVQEVLDCEQVPGPSTNGLGWCIPKRSRDGIGHEAVEWTDRGCPVAVKVADAATNDHGQPPADAELERLRALVGDEDQPGWGSLSRAEAIRQANEFHTGRLHWIDEHDKRRAERDEARAEAAALRKRLDEVMAALMQGGQTDRIRWSAAVALLSTPLPYQDGGA